MPYKDPDKQKEAQRQHYQTNKKLYKQRDRQRKIKMREWYAEIKAEYKCMQCGETHPACLVFHHRNPSEKNENISSMIANRSSKKKILEEIKKCDCLCSNCHLKIHWNQNSKYQKKYLNIN